MNSWATYAWNDIVGSSSALKGHVDGLEALIAQGHDALTREVLLARVQSIEYVVTRMRLALEEPRLFEKPEKKS